MQHLRKPPQNNFATFAAVFAGINNAAVCRLRFTRRELPKEEKKVSPPSSQARGCREAPHLTPAYLTPMHTPAQTLEELERLMSPENSYANYRAAYENARPPMIPFLYVVPVFLPLGRRAARVGLT